MSDANMKYMKCELRQITSILAAHIPNKVKHHRPPSVIAFWTNLKQIETYSYQTQFFSQQFKMQLAILVSFACKQCDCLPVFSKSKTLISEIIQGFFIVFQTDICHVWDCCLRLSYIIQDFLVIKLWSGDHAHLHNVEYSSNF